MNWGRKGLRGEKLNQVLFPEAAAGHWWLVAVADVSHSPAWGGKGKLGPPSNTAMGYLPPAQSCPARGQKENGVCLLGCTASGRWVPWSFLLQGWRWRDA